MRKLLKLSPAEVILLLHAYRWLLWGRGELRGLRGEGWLIGDTERHAAEKNRDNRPSDDDIGRMVRAIDRAARTPVRWSKCLQNSLALRKWLSTKGVLADLHIGVKKENQGIAAHAWLEFEDEVLNDTLDATSQYSALTRGIRDKKLSDLSSLAWE